MNDFGGKSGFLCQCGFDFVIQSLTEMRYADMDAGQQQKQEYVQKQRKKQQETVKFLDAVEQRGMCSHFFQTPVLSRYPIPRMVSMFSAPHSPSLRRRLTIWTSTARSVTG